MCSGARARYIAVDEGDGCGNSDCELFLMVLIAAMLQQNPASTKFGLVSPRGHDELEARPSTMPAKRYSCTFQGGQVQALAAITDKDVARGTFSLAHER